MLPPLRLSQLLVPNFWVYSFSSALLSPPFSTDDCSLSSLQVFALFLGPCFIFPVTPSQFSHTDPDRLARFRCALDLAIYFNGRDEMPSRYFVPSD